LLKTVWSAVVSVKRIDVVTRIEVESNLHGVFIVRQKGMKTEVFLDRHKKDRYGMAPIA
jgi:hypothetical protein